jgi:restriction system protein
MPGRLYFRPAVAEERIEAEKIKEAAEAELGLESHLEDFIIENWDNLELGNKYALLDNDGDMISKQYPTDVGPNDILARSKYSKEWLVIELKKGRSGDQVVGQIQRYMDWVLHNHVRQGDGESVKRGLIILKNTDTKLEYALEVTRDIELMTYTVNFSLNKPKK